MGSEMCIRDRLFPCALSPCAVSMRDVPRGLSSFLALLGPFFLSWPSLASDCSLFSLLRFFYVRYLRALFPCALFLAVSLLLWPSLAPDCTLSVSVLLPSNLVPCRFSFVSLFRLRSLSFSCFRLSWLLLISSPLLFLYVVLGLLVPELMVLCCLLFPFLFACRFIFACALLGFM